MPTCQSYEVEIAIFTKRGRKKLESCVKRNALLKKYTIPVFATTCIDLDRRTVGLNFLVLVVSRPYCAVPVSQCL